MHRLFSGAHTRSKIWANIKLKMDSNPNAYHQIRAAAGRQFKSAHTRHFQVQSQGGVVKTPFSFLHGLHIMVVVYMHRTAGQHHFRMSQREEGVGLEGDWMGSPMSYCYYLQLCTTVHVHSPSKYLMGRDGESLPIPELIARVPLTPQIISRKGDNHFKSLGLVASSH